MLLYGSYQNCDCRKYKCHQAACVRQNIGEALDLPGVKGFIFIQEEFKSEQGETYAVVRNSLLDVKKPEVVVVSCGWGEHSGNPVVIERYLILADFVVVVLAYLGVQRDPDVVVDFILDLISFEVGLVEVPSQ